MKSKSEVYQSPLSKLYAKQQPKVKAKKTMRNLLMTFAENDHQRIAKLIKSWLVVN